MKTGVQMSLQLGRMWQVHEKLFVKEVEDSRETS